MNIIPEDGSTAGIKGVSLVDHSPRVALGLSCDEYVAANYIEQCVKLKRNPIKIKKDPEFLWKKTGMRPQEIIPLLLKLLDKGIITKDVKGIHITDRWKKAHKNPNADRFLEFWDVYGHLGNKKEAERRFNAALKLTTYEHLLKQHQKYATHLEENTWRKKMACAVFLNPTTERWEDEYERKGTGFES